MTAASVFVYGTVCLDRFVFAGGADAGATLLPGGEAFNTAIALAGWGVPATLTGTAVGDDAEGLLLRELLQMHPLAAGIDITLLPFISGAVTPVCDIRVDARGERMMSGRGFKEALAPPLNLLLLGLAERPLFTVDPNLGESAVAATVAAARAGCRVVSMDCADVPEILALSEITLTSAEWVARIGKDATLADATRRMTDAGARAAIVTDGARGITVYAPETGAVEWHPSIAPDSPIIDTTGAGDIFRAGLCYGMARGEDIRESVYFARAAAALHCAKVGGGSRSSLAEVAALIDAASAREATSS